MNDEIITSASNPRIKYVQSLIKKSNKRRSGNVFVVEGVRMVLDAPISDIKHVFVSSEIFSGDSIAHFLDNCTKASVEITVVSPKIMGVITDTVTPQGIVAIINRREYNAYLGGSSFLLLEDVRDPGNLGTLLRTAEAAGIDTVIMSKGCVDVYNPKTIRSTMGTIYRLPIVKCVDETNWTDTIYKLTDDGVKIYGGCLDDSVYYCDADFTGRCGIVIGNEGDGISDKTLEMIDRVHIPMQGDIESLNAAVAGSILMYEMNRQRLSEV